MKTLRRTAPFALFLPLVLAPLACGGGDDDEPEIEDVGPTGTPSEDDGSTPSGGSARADLRVDPERPNAIFGVVTYDGTPPTMREVGHTAGCGDATGERLQELWVVEDGKVANAVVWLEKRPAELESSPAPEDPAVLDQSACLYVPHVQAMRTGQTLLVKNSDPTNHNVNVDGKKNPDRNPTMQQGAPPLEIVFELAEQSVEFKCDIHPWMNAHVAVFDHSFFAVTGADGSWSIDGLVPGTYEVRLWHEEGGIKRFRNVVLDETGGVEVPFALKDR